MWFVEDLISCQKVVVIDGYLVNQEVVNLFFDWPLGVYAWVGRPKMISVFNLKILLVSVMSKLEIFYGGTNGALFQEFVG